MRRQILALLLLLQCSMKSLPKILLALIAVATTSFFSVQPAQAFTVTVDQVGSNVVATGSGAFNLTGLNFVENTISGVAAIQANQGVISIGPGSKANVSVYTGFTGPTSFGSGDTFLANTSSGDWVVLGGLGLFLPQGYVSGHALSDSMTFNNATFASLGLTPGT